MRYFKLVILGDSGVGKTSIVWQLKFNCIEQCPQPTVFSEFFSKLVKVDDWPVKLQIWDTAGQERYKSLVQIYFKNAHIGLFVFDFSDAKSLESLADYVAKFRSHNERTIAVLVGNKCDLHAKQEVSLESAHAFRERFALDWLASVSAKDRTGIDELFHECAVRASATFADPASQSSESASELTGDRTMLLSTGPRIRCNCSP